ncbi:class I SAM-dependent methyltransferase [Stutzerimonas tarimensis]|uniref:Class I SAM-dependent methyltransferase n=1 Tax=Stutzerimonas tarimensis TaxID=1507735 RepID=A0ABV7TB53_9GAMM
MSEFDTRAKGWDAERSRVERAAAVAECIVARVPLNTDMRGLEYGCGTGLLSFALRSRLGPLTLADNSPGMLAVVREKLAQEDPGTMAALQLDLTSDPLPDQHFEILYTQMTLHHVADTGALLQCFNRLLTPGGYLCIADLDAEDGSFHGAGFTGHNGFDRHALAAQVETAGFAEVGFDTVFHVHRGERDYPVFLLVARKP